MGSIFASSKRLMARVVRVIWVVKEIAFALLKGINMHVGWLHSNVRMMTHMRYVVDIIL